MRRGHGPGKVVGVLSKESQERSSAHPEEAGAVCRDRVESRSWACWSYHLNTTVDSAEPLSKDYDVLCQQILVLLGSPESLLS